MDVMRILVHITNMIEAIVSIIQYLTCLDDVELHRGAGSTKFPGMRDREDQWCWVSRLVECYPLPTDIDR